MEYPSKRQRVSDAVKRSGNHGRLGTDKSPLMARMSEGDEYRDHGGMRTEEMRDVERHHVTPTVGTVQTVTASILDVIVDNGSSAVASITLSAIPTEPTVVAIPTLGSLTIPGYPLSASSLPIETTSPSNAGSQPSTSSGDASSENSAAPAAQSSLSIQVPNMSSQVLLSSPPSTPLPLSQTMSLPSASSDSYFPSPTTEAATSAESSTIATSTSASFPAFTPSGNYSTASKHETQSFHSSSFLNRLQHL